VALARPPIADVIAILQTAPLILSWRWLFSFVNVSERRAISWDVTCRHAFR
jgi:hypothetical protein